MKLSFIIVEALKSDISLKTHSPSINTSVGSVHSFPYKFKIYVKLYKFLYKIYILELIIYFK